MTIPVIYFVVPCYCEEDILPLSAPVFLEKLESLIESGKADEKSKVVFIDDGSTDKTWCIIEDLSKQSKYIDGVRLLKNCGEYNAQRAGMYIALHRSDCVVTIDCDLQDDINAVDEMLDKFAKGNSMVLGIRSTRDEDPLMERFFSGAFYFIMSLFQTGLIKNHNSFCLLDAKATDLLLSHKEPVFLPTLESSILLKKDIVYYKRKAREKGTTKYSFFKKLTLAFDSIVLHAKHVRALLLGGAAALLCVAAGFLFLLLKNAAGLAGLWGVLLAVFALTGAAAAGVCIAYKRMYAGACSRNKTGFEIAETTFK